MTRAAGDDARWEEGSAAGGGGSVATGTAVTADAAVARDSAVVAAGMLISRISGLGRVVVTAAVLGPTFFGNLFQTTNLLPHLTYSALAGSLVSALLVPPLVKAHDRGDPDAAGRVAGGLLGTMLAATAVVGSAVALAGPLLLRPLTASLPSPADADAAVRIALVLLAILVPQVVLLAVAGVGAAVQQSRDRFALASVAPLFENIGVMATMGLAGVMFGTGIEVGAVSDPQLYLLAGGTTASVGLHAGIQWWGARRAGVTIRPRMGWRDPDVRAVLRLAPPSIGTTAITAGRYVGVAVVAGQIPGGTVAFQMALNVYHLPIALISTPVGVAVTPRLARSAQSGPPGGAGRTAGSARFAALYDDALRLTWFLLVPAALAVVVLAPALADAIAFGAMDDPGGQRLVAVSLAALGLAMAGEGTIEISRRASYALRNARLPFEAMVVRAGVTAAGLALATRFEAEGVLVMLGLTFVVGDLLSAAWLDRRLRRHLAAHGGRPVALGLARMGAVGMVVALLGLTVANLVADLTTGRVPGSLASTVPVVVAAAVGTLAYGLINRALGSPELADLMGLMRRRGGARRREVTAPSGRKVTAPFRRDVTAPFRRHGPVVSVTAAALGATVAGGVAVGRFDVAGGGGVVAVLAFVAVAARPAWAVATYVALLPFLAGMPRGDLIPLVRPTELLQAFLTAGVVAGLVLRLLAGRELRVPWTRVDSAFALMAFTASAVPLLWLAIRGLPLTLDELLATVPLVKYLALFLLVRWAITTPRQVRVCLVISVIVAVVTGVVATFQALGLFGAPELIATFWRPEGTDVSGLTGGRGSGFLGSPIATATFVTHNLAIAVALALNERRSRLWAGTAAVVLTICSFGIGQITGIVALGIVAVTVGALTRRLGAIARVGAVLVPLAVVLVWPVLDQRLADTQESSGMPISWVVRWDNLVTFYWAELDGFNWLLGVRPNSVIVAPETWREVIYLESGYLWLLWVGGVPLLAAFLWFAWAALRALVDVVNRRNDPVGSAALAGAAALVSVVVLATIDMHITTRGEADLAYVLLGLALAVRTRTPMAPPANGTGRRLAAGEPMTDGRTGPRRELTMGTSSRTDDHREVVP